MNGFNQLLQIMQQFQNPQQILQRMGIPQECMKSPEDAAQYLLQNGKVTQEQINQAQNMYGKFFRR